MKNQSKISVVIPALRKTQPLEALIRQLQSPLIHEIIVVSPHPTLDIRNKKILYLCSSVGRGPQIQAGLQKASGEIIWVLHADSKLPIDAEHDVVTILADQSVSLGAFRVAFEGNSSWLKIFSQVSRFDSPLTTFGDQGYFFRRAALSNLPDLVSFPLLEDVVIRKNLSKLGIIRKSKHAIITSTARFERYGPLRTQFKNIIILWKFWRGTSPACLYKKYYNQT